MWYISEVTSPNEQARRLAESESDNSQVTRLTRQIAVAKEVARGMQETDTAQTLYKRACKEGEQSSLDCALIALDHINVAKNLTRNVHRKAFSKAKLLEGQIFLNIVGNKCKAHDCFDEIVKIYEATGDYAEECSEAKFHLEELEIEEEKKKRNGNKEYSKAVIKAELMQLEGAKEMSDKEFVAFLFSTFPPKHRDDYRLPAMSSRSSTRTAFIRLSNYYHPDKINTSIHGQEYKVLCEEIAKNLNARFAKFKSVSQ